MEVILGSDLGGVKLKEIVKEFLILNNYKVEDLTPEPAIDFVESSLSVGNYVLESEDRLGILFDAYGAGSFIAATKIKKMVVAEVSDERSAYMTREHNNSRMITLGQEIVGVELAKKIVTNFLDGHYEGGRHQIRIDMLNKML